MIPLRVRGNARARLGDPTRLAGTVQNLTRGDQGVVPIPTEPTTLDRATMLMDDPGKALAHPATLKNTLLNLSRNDLIGPVTFVNTLIPTTKSTKDITGNIACPGIFKMKQKHVIASDRDSLTNLAKKTMKKTMILSSILSNATGPS